MDCRYFHHILEHSLMYLQEHDDNVRELFLPRLNVVVESTFRSK